MILAPNTAAAANHAAEHGYIAAEALPSIGVAAAIDASGPVEVEAILDELDSPSPETQVDTAATAAPDVITEEAETKTGTETNTQ